MFEIGIKKRCKKLYRSNVGKLLLAALLFVVSITIVFIAKTNDYSKISWSKGAVDSQISVRANDNAFSADVKMAVERSDDEEIAKIARSAAGQGDQDVYAYNITFLDKDGNETQPNSRVKVTISPKEFELKANRYALVHIDDNHVPIAALSIVPLIITAFIILWQNGRRRA